MKCNICNEEIPTNAVQQMIKKHDRILPAHFNCGTAWCTEYVDVYEIKHDGVGYIDIDPNSVIELIKDSEIGETYTITKKKMQQQKYYNLKEFTGF